MDFEATTHDGKKIELGMKVFTYDAKWGTVIRQAFVDTGIPGGPNPWFEVKHDDGTTGTYDGSRMVTREPRF